MAVDRDCGEITLVCDSLGVRYKRTYDSDDFDRLIADAKEDGWAVVLEGRIWRHYSPGVDRSGMALDFDVE